MMRFVLGRLFLLVPVLIIVLSAVFWLQRLIPGDPVDFILGESAMPADRAQLLAWTRLDLPVGEQFVLFWKNLAQGDLGRSYFSGKSVQELVAERLPYTLLLAFCAMIWAFIIALPLGVMAALHRNRWLDRLLLTTSLIGISLPVFYTGPLLVLVFSLGLDLLPTSGVRSWNSWILPSLTLGIAFAALLIRMTRASVLDVLHRDFIRTARAKGLSSWVVLARHVVRASLIPVVSIMGLQFGALLAGAVVTEKIYSWPGMGTLMLEAISRRDYGVVQGCVVVISVCYVGVNFMIDLVYARLDPRIRLDG